MKKHSNSYSRSFPSRVGSEARADVPVPGMGEQVLARANGARGGSSTVIEMAPVSRGPGGSSARWRRRAGRGGTVGVGRGRRGAFGRRRCRARSGARAQTPFRAPRRGRSRCAPRAALKIQTTSRLAFAEAAFAAASATRADELLAMIHADRDWNEGAARATLVKMFEAIGLEDAWVVATRRRLSRLLFG